jgi:glucokinase
MADCSICGIGFAVPAVLDMERGTIELLPNFTPEWAGFPLQDELESRYHLPALLLNDVRAAALAEHRWGAGRAYRNMICITLGTGVGGGLILDGRLYLGSRGAAGEIGHQTAISDGERCGCGNYGCLETVAAGPAIARAARLAIASGDRELERLAGTGDPTPSQVAAAARAGSAGARAIFEQVGRTVGLMLGNLICVLNPEAIVVGGGVAGAGDLLLDPMREEIERRTAVFSRERGHVDVLASPLHNRAGAMGAACWAWQHAWEAAPL